nr:uncharacterized protein LOC109423289 isoform X1 [Aedes albopictus]
MTSDVEDLITGLRCDVSLPEKKVQVFIDTISSVLSWTQRYTMSVIKSYIETKQLSLEDDDTLELLNAVHIPNIVSTVRTHKSNVSNLEVKAGCTIPEPVEHVLGRTKTIHRVLLLPTRGKKFQNLVKQNQVSKKVRLQKDVYHYIPIIDTLRLIMTNPGAREMIESEARQFDDTIRTFKDGHQFTLHAFLNDHPCALRLSFHIDEGEYADALGSRKGKNKLTNVCIKIQNIDARINSSLDRVYIALMVKSSVLKKYGYRKVFQPLIEDLLKLESKEGVKLKTAAAHRVTDEILWDFDENDLIAIGITEKGPIKLILKYIADKKPQEENPSSSSTHEESEVTIRAILKKDVKFQKVIHRYLDYDLVPDHKGLLHMNRILTTHFFEHQICKEYKYPTWQQKQKLAKKILEEFPQLKSTRVNDDAPPESHFFWKNGGRKTGCHTGLIETRVGNMRKDVPEDKRAFRRTKQNEAVKPDELEELACSIAAISPTPQNARNICESMAQCFPLHEWLLKSNKENKPQEILRTFPHLLAYYGLLIQQAFDRLKPIRQQEKELDRFLRMGILLDKDNWNNVHDPHIKGLLRMFKNLTNRGIKRKAEEGSMQPDEEIASPLIRWIKLNGEGTDYDAIKTHANKDLPPHIVCVGELFQPGNYHLIFDSMIVPCGDSASRAVDVFFKAFDVMGVAVPSLLRNVHSLIAFSVFGSIDNPCSQTVLNLVDRLSEIDRE